MTDPKITRRATLGAAAALGASALSPAEAQPARRPVARTRYGSVRGMMDGDVAVFKGIRYGADTAPRRFQAPLPPRPWRGTLDAIAYGPASPQRNNEANQSEDCLFLNVWTPGLRDRRHRTVMVYIHGGAYSNGSGSSALYDGAKLARRGDVVVVTLNHRLNAFGYCALARFGGEEFVDSGNAGQLDLILALQWVRDNIAEFGGDPGNVMVFGQSGGGAKIATLMAMPAARGLFHRATTMSGQQVTATGPLNGERRTEAYLGALHLTRANVQQLRTMPVTQLVEAQNVTDPVLLSGGVYFGPVLDFKNLMRHPFYPDAAPQGLTIPMMLGNTRDETRGFTNRADPNSWNLTWDQVIARLPAQIRIDTDPAYVVREFRQHYPQWSPTDVYYAASTSARSWRGQVIEAEERAKAGAPGYVYQVNLNSTLEPNLRAPHTIDIGLSFGNLDAPSSLTGTGPAAEAASRALQDAFIAFAKTGDPNCPSIPRWTPYTLPTRETMIVDAQCRMESNPRGWEREFFAKIPYIQPGT